MNQFGIFTDVRGRRWICGHALKILFGIVEPVNKKFWDYDKLCQQFSQRRKSHETNSRVRVRG
ncbi:MAG: hypothetical protein IJ685_00495 [Selenomonadaceae bacterium]|nr:hypothetical protein [Selenomonadaceae bacterium]